MRNLCLYLFLLTPPLAYAQEEISSYGDLFLIEEKIQMEDTFEIQAVMGNVVNNSAFEVYSGHLNLQYHLTNYFNMGLSVGYNRVEESENFKALENEIRDDGTIQAFYPETELFLKFGMLPLKGNLNLFNSGSLSYYLFTDLSLGMVKTKDLSPGANGAIGLKIDLNSYFSLLTGYRQNIYFLETGTDLSGSALLGLSINLR